MKTKLDQIPSWLYFAGGAALSSASLIAYRTYLQDHAAALRALKMGSRVISTGRGPIEAAEFGSGQPVLVLHGTLGGYDQGLAIAEVFNDANHRFIAVSRPGYLRTPLDSGRSPLAQAALCEALLDKLGIERAMVIAASGSGPVGVQLASYFPSRCYGLVLLSSITRRPPPLPTGYRQIMAGPQSLMKCDFPWWLATRVGLKMMLRSNGASRELTAEVLRDPQKVRLLNAIYQTGATISQRYAGVVNDGLHLENLPAYNLKQLSVPTLIVHSTADRLAPYLDAKLTASEIPGAQFLAVEDGGHVCFVTHRETIAPVVMEFIRQSIPA